MRKWLGVFAAVILAAGLWRFPGKVGAQNYYASPVSGTLSSANAVLAITPVGNAATCGVDIANTWQGTIAFQVIGQNNVPYPANAIAYNGSLQGTSTTSNGMFYWSAGLAKICQIVMSSYTSGTASATLSLSSAPLGFVPSTLTENVNITGPLTGGGSVPVHPDTSPLPSVSPWPYPQFMKQKAGSGSTTYTDGWPDIAGFSALLSGTTSTTTQIVAGIAGSNTYIWRLVWVAGGGTNTSPTGNFVWGTGTNCATVVGTFWPISQQTAAASGNTTAFWANGIGTGSSAFGVPGPAAQPFIVPPGDSICGVNAGTAFSGYWVWNVTQHPN